MKLRNKKTGEIVDVESLGHAESLKEKYGYQVTLSWKTKYENLSQCKSYESLAGVLEEWEDYEPKEPLIKDEKIRKAVRAFWEAIPDAVTDKRILYKKNQDLAVGVYSIYCGAIYPETLEVGKMYSIAELCGEEEE